MAFPQRGGDRGGPGGTGNLKINFRIRARQVRVVDAEGAQLGIMAIQDALKKAEEAGLDLVEVSPASTPPVCRIMDYGKFKYDTKKRAAESRRNQSVVEIKEVKLRPKTDEHDRDFKVKHVQRFLEDGNKVKLTIMFRGREITHAEIGREILREVADMVKTIGQVESMPRIEGRNMFMILTPLKKGGGGQPKPAAAAGDGGAREPRERPAPRGASAGPEIEVKQKLPSKQEAGASGASEESKG